MKSFLGRTARFAQASSATQFSAMELSVVIYCRVDVQSSAALFTFNKILVVRRLLSFHPAQLSSEKAFGGGK